MASKYRVTVSFGLETEIGPEGVERQFDNDRVDYVDFESDSYFSTQNVEVDGGTISFVVEADDETEAEEKGTKVLFDGYEVEDDNGFTWVASGVSYDVETLEWEPSVEEAIEFLSTWVEENLDQGDGTDPGRAAKAAQVVLDDHARLGQRVESLESRVSEMEAQIRQLSERLAQ